MLITCVYKTGGDFDADYVIALYNSLNQYGDFLCFTDADDVPDCIPQTPLKHGWKGWWSKIEMLGYGKDMLFFDLDVIITGNLDKMIYVAGKWDKMIMLSDFYRPSSPASGVMYIPAEVGIKLYERFLTKPDFYMVKHRGDQDFIAAQWSDIDRWQDLLGDDYIISYKAHVIKTAPKHFNIRHADVNNAKVVAFHGKPRIKDTAEKWNIELEKING